MHTNNAVGTLNRMADMGVESYLIADSMVGVIAQRLVRKLCPHCKKSHMATTEEKKLLRLPPDKAAISAIRQVISDVSVSLR